MTKNKTTKAFDPRYALQFHCNGETVGVLHWSRGRLVFMGQMEISAETFFRVLKPAVDNYIADRLGRKPKKKRKRKHGK
jgi:hypothetical protein